MSFETEHALNTILLRVCTRSGCGFAAARRLADPLIWWVSTGRCSGSVDRVLRRLSARQVTAIADRLIKAAGDYDAAVKSCKSFLEMLAEKRA